MSIDNKLWKWTRKPKKYFIGDCMFYEYEGTHFFIQGHHGEMADIIREKCAGGKINDI